MLLVISNPATNQQVLTSLLQTGKKNPTQTKGCNLAQPSFRVGVSHRAELSGAPRRVFETCMPAHLSPRMHRVHNTRRECEPGVIG